jgi:hypothetical protein
LFPEADGVCLDFRNFDGTPVRTHFAFTDTGKILHTICDEIREAAYRFPRLDVAMLSIFDREQSQDRGASKLVGKQANSATRSYCGL